MGVISEDVKCMTIAQKPQKEKMEICYRKGSYTKQEIIKYDLKDHNKLRRSL